MPTARLPRRGRYRPIDIDRSPSYIHQASIPLRFRPVRPAQSAWHEMPGDASPELRRPVRAVLSKYPQCVGWHAGAAAFEERSWNRMQSTSCSRYGAKNWPYRPEAPQGWWSRDFIPGWWTWPYRPESEQSVPSRAPNCIGFHSIISNNRHRTSIRQASRCVSGL